MRRLRKQSNGETTEVDMTPMLDIVFIMLIFFIVTTTFVKEDGIEFVRPQATTIDPVEISKPILISINDVGDIRMNGRLIDIDAVQANVESARAANPKAAVVVKAHHASKSGTVVRAVDQAKLAGAGAVTVVKSES
jgi:biopolymer transport protein ExbD